MMRTIEDRVPGNGGPDYVLVRNADVLANANKTSGVLTLFAHGEEYSTIQTYLENKVAKGVFLIAGHEEPTEDPAHVRTPLIAMLEGQVTRGRLKGVLEGLSRAGYTGSWLYIDLGSARHEKARRVLSGKRPTATITEYDLRKDHENPIIKAIPFDKLGLAWREQ